MTEFPRVTVAVAEDGSLTGAGAVILIQDGKGIEITTHDRIIERVRALAAPYFQGRGSLADELIANCRAEAAREEAEAAADRDGAPAGDRNPPGT